MEEDLKDNVLIWINRANLDRSITKPRSASSRKSLMILNFDLLFLLDRGILQKRLLVQYLIRINRAKNDL